MDRPPRLEIRDATKVFGSVEALGGVSLDVRAGEVHCLLGDNGAGKSTLIKILSGAHAPTSGEIRFEGAVVRFASPRDALDHGIATVYQDLALIPLMSVARNFFLGREPTRGPLRWLDLATCRRVAIEELQHFGLELRDPDQPAGTLSGGERQCLAIARAVHRGARVVILDEPTAALGVTQTEQVLQTIRRLRERDLGILLITHNARHAHTVGDRFTILERGRGVDSFARDEIDLEGLQECMAGQTKE